MGIWWTAPPGICIEKLAEVTVIHVGTLRQLHGSLFDCALHVSTVDRQLWEQRSFSLRTNHGSISVRCLSKQFLLINMLSSLYLVQQTPCGCFVNNVQHEMSMPSL